jgi:hypothetical protein
VLLQSVSGGFDDRPGVAGFAVVDVNNVDSGGGNMCLYTYTIDPSDWTSWLIVVDVVVVVVHLLLSKASSSLQKLFAEQMIGEAPPSVPQRQLWSLFVDPFLSAHNGVAKHLSALFTPAFAYTWQYLLPSHLTPGEPASPHKQAGTFATWPVRFVHLVAVEQREAASFTLLESQ